MKPSIILQGITAEELITQIETIIDQRIEENLLKLQKPQPFHYLTRAEVSVMLKISLPTLHDWRKLGFLKGYKIANRVYFRSDELEASIEQKSLKFRKRERHF